MKNLNWVFEEGDYTLETPFGKAIITETEVTWPIKKYHFAGKKFKYEATFESSSRDVTNSEKSFSHFDDAEAWIMYVAILDFDQPQGEKANNIKKLTKTLDHCKELLPKDIHNSHFQRLELIARVLHGEIFFDSMFEDPPNLNYSLDWHERSDMLSAETPFGTAYVTIKNQDKRWHHGDATKYIRPRIVHKSGAETRYVWHSFPNFVAAEEWIMEKIYLLENPTGGKADLDNFIFTLDICTALLPEDEDIIHYLRLKWIMDRVSQIVL